MQDSNYSFDGYAGNFPKLTLVKGELYYFDLSGVGNGHPFALRLASEDTDDVPGTTKQ